MIVGTTARADWRGPKVLKGRTVTTGSPYARWKDSTSLSAAILVAAYGDCACSGCFSSIGTYRAVPYTSLDEVWTTRVLPLSRAACSTFSVPQTFVCT